ncbi:antitoxin [Streptomyces durbertensis]|uniref:Antitoxin n=1 Tax=Streptomyces durbertensis TaxID=2448886 RepID=A0ABR6EG86_9ACTN|nr:antitoxin [Streptomyces durbertensis]MBB1243975.1 antitoxin [Streptomyces durbertensis]
MGLMDKVGKVKDLLGQHSDKVGEGLEKAAKAVDAKTKGKYSDQIKTGTEKAKEAVGRLSEEDKTDGKTDGKGGDSSARKDA